MESEPTVKITSHRREFSYDYEGITITKLAPFPADPPVVNRGKFTSYVSFVDEFHGERLPGWKSYIRNHLNATTNATGKRYDELQFPKIVAALKQVQTSKVSPFYTQITGTFKAQGTHPSMTSSYFAPSQAVINDVHNRAVGAGINKVQSIMSSLQTGEDFGELKQSIATLTNPMATLRKGLTSYLTVLSKKRDRGSLRRMRPQLRKTFLKKTLADTYLEYSFGWKPLVSSISNAFVGLQNKASHFEYVPFEVNASKEFTSSDQEIGITLGIPGTLYFGNTVVAKYAERWKGEVKTGAGDSGRLSEFQILGLTPDRWVPTVYNLLPYSWLVDYFTNVGDLVSASTFRFSDIAWACQTTRSETITKYAFRRYDFGKTFEEDVFKTIVRQGNAGGGATTFTAVEFHRAPLLKSQIVPTLRFHLPMPGVRPWLNIGAVLHQLGRRITPYI